MKSIVALAATALLLSVGAGTASAATPDPRVAALQKQTAALQKRVTALEKNLTAARQLAVVAIVYAQCLTAATADAFAGTWNVVDQIAQATQAGKVYFGPQAPVNDFESCQSAQITRQTTVPPNVSVFSALTTLIGS